MAVKKTAKKSAAKKAPAKKVAAKKAVAKKASVKKVAAKKAVAKKVAKKAPAKKVAAKKVVAKKAPVKKASAKKAVAKKAPAKKVAAKKSATRIVIDDLAPAAAVAVHTSPVVSIDSSPKAVSPATASPTPGAVPTQKSSSRVVLWVVIGVILIAVLVVARNHNPAKQVSNTDTTPAATATSTPSDTSSPAAMTSADSTPAAAASSTPAAAAAATDLAPVGIVAHYTSTGATIFWAADAGSTGLTTYNIEASSSGGAFKLVATVPSTQLSLDVTKASSNGWTSFKISAVYSDGNIVAGKVFGLPGQYA